MESHDLQPPGRRSRGRLAVVSGYAHNQLTPRGQRTQRLIECLRADWAVELTALPSETFKPSDRARPSRASWRKAAGRVVNSTLLDKWEPWSVHRLARWRPDVDAALLIAYPWSPVAYAARRLRQARIPYVLDAGDPWALTAPAPIGGRLTRRRWRRAERSLWSSASGAVVTTAQQAEVLAGLFPTLPVLVRPNGYEPSAEPPRRAEDPAESDPRELRLVHYGSLPYLRVDVTRLLGTLVASGRWDSIRLTQFGDDYEGMLRRAPAEVEIEWRAPRPWSEVLAEARTFDLALAIGNVLPGQLPSKAVQYMTLPIPRLAVTVQRQGDALGDYVRDRPGWAAIEWDDPDADRVVWEHLSRDWSGAALEPPRDEAWPAVATRIADFVAACVAPERGRAEVSYAGTRPQGA
jgi:glycosyltransferase involved in cell wall biosynthesis